MPSNTMIHYEAWKGVSRNMSVAVAQDFIDGSVDLETAPQCEGATYQIHGDTTAVRNEDEEGNIAYWGNLPTADFVSAVAFCLAEQGVITPESASTTNVARVCLALGTLMLDRQPPEGANG